MRFSIYEDSAPGKQEFFVCKMGHLPYSFGLFATHANRTGPGVGTDNLIGHGADVHRIGYRQTVAVDKYRRAAGG